MSPEQWSKIKEIFTAAVEIADRQARARFLDEKCGADEALKREVEHLIALDEDADSLMHRPLMEESGIHVFADLIEDGGDPLIGRRIGKYEIKKEIGAGGMGAVYLAERADGIFKKQVAVKLVKRGMDTQFILRRFRQERQILAKLNHPFIAGLIDGGTTEDGLPFFVLDYVEGEPLYRYCDNRQLDISDRLKLFRQICEAVEYAHKRQVIHRDLKPSNILIGADAAPRLLDFGIAKVFNPDLQSETNADPTATHLRMMTPEYASPEQVKGETVTAASDIYALGVLLYELLTCHRPYHLKSRAPHEISRVICEEEPIAPSQVNAERGMRIADLKYIPQIDDFTAENGNSNNETPQSAIRTPHWEALDKIILKMLRKHPFERYDSVAAAAEDITNYLEKRAVKAEFFPVSVKTREIVSRKTAENYAPAIEKISRGAGEPKSVAVLPFKFLSTTGGNMEDEFLGLGLADALITRLSKIHSFQMRPTSSVLRFHAAEPLAAGRELGVSYVLDGNIRRAGNRVRVSVQLLNIRNNSTNWAQVFDEDFTDVLEIEDSISEQVAGSLIPQLSELEQKRFSKRSTNSPQAYEAYLRGRFYANQFTDEALPKSIEAFREAVRLDPDYALPHVGIADFYVLSAIFGLMTSHEAYPQAKAQLHQAIRADNTLAEAYSLLAFIAILYDWNWTEAERLVKLALEFNPNYYLAHDVSAHIFASQGVAEQAISEIKFSEELDPLSPRSKLMTSCICYQSRNFEEGAAKAEESLVMQPNSPAAFLHLGNSLTHIGKTEKAIEVLSASAKVWEASALPKYMLCFALVADGQRDEARKILDSVLSAAETQYVKPYFVAMACAALGEVDLAFKWFEKAVEGRDDWMIWFGTDVKLDILRNDARYFEILRKMNNPIIARQKKNAE